MLFTFPNPELEAHESNWRVSVCLFFFLCLSCWLNTSLNFSKPFATMSITFLWTYQWPSPNPSCKEFKVCPFSRDLLESCNLLVVMASDQMGFALVSRKFMSWLAWFTLTSGKDAVLATLRHSAPAWWAIHLFSVSYIEVCMGLTIAERNCPYFSKCTNCASVILCSHKSQHPLRSRGSPLTSAVENGDTGQQTQFPLHRQLSLWPQEGDSGYLLFSFWKRA